jgi:hypothetical protein
VGKRKMTLRKTVRKHAQTLMYHEYRPKLIGPGVKFSSDGLTHDGNAITTVEGDSTDLPLAKVRELEHIENGRDGGADNCIQVG